VQLVAVILEVCLVKIKLGFLQGRGIFWQIIRVDIGPLEHLPASDYFIECVNEEVQLIYRVAFNVVELLDLVMHHRDHFPGDGFGLFVVHVPLEMEGVSRQFVL